MKILKNFTPLNLNMSENYLFSGAMSCAMKMAGEKDFDYWFFAMVTGDTFTQVYSRDNSKYYDCLSSVIFNESHIEKAFKLCGYAYDFICENELAKNPEKYYYQIVGSVNKNKPVILKHKDDSWFSMVIGVNDDKVLMKTVLFEAGIEKLDLDAFKDMAKSLVFVGDKKENVDLKSIYKDTIMNIPSYINMKASHDASFGNTAFIDWALGLIDGRYDKIENLNLGNVNENHLINLGTNKDVHSQISRVSDLLPDMGGLVGELKKHIIKFDKIYNRLSEESKGFSLDKKEQMKLLNEIIMECVAINDDICGLF